MGIIASSLVAATPVLLVLWLWARPLVIGRWRTPGWFIATAGLCVAAAVTWFIGAFADRLPAPRLRRADRGQLDDDPSALSEKTATKAGSASVTLSVTADPRKALTFAGVRSEAVRAEQTYEAWQATKLTATTELHDEVFYVDELPTSEDIPKLLADPPAMHRRLVEFAKRLGVLVTCDSLGEPVRAAQDARPIKEVSPDPGWLLYRVQQPAVLITWRLGQGKEKPKAERVDRVMVIRKDAERAIDVLAEDTAALGVTFDESGALVKLAASSENPQSERAAVTAALPGALKGAAEAGQALIAPFTADAKAKTAQAEFDEAEARRKLADLRTPAADPLGKLRSDVEEAELNARLAAAQHLASTPGTTVTVIRLEG